MVRVVKKILKNWKLWGRKQSITQQEQNRIEQNYQRLKAN